MLSDLARGLAVLLAAGFALLVGLAPALFRGAGFALLVGRLLPSALVSELFFLLAPDRAGVPGFVPVPGRRPVRSCRGLSDLSGFGALVDLLVPGALFVGRDVLPALGFRPVELFALGDALPLPAAFLMVN